MKKTLWLALVALFVLTACANRSEYTHLLLKPEQAGYTAQKFKYAGGYTPQESGFSTYHVEPSPTGPILPHTAREAAYRITYRQITGTIISIQGLVTNGAIHPDVDWLEIHIEDSYGMPATLVATRWTVVPFDGFFVGETITAYVNTDTAILVEDRPIYLASVLVVNAPSGVYIGYFGLIEGKMERRGDRFFFYGFNNDKYDFICSDGITRKTNNSTTFAYNRIELLDHLWLSEVNEGLVFIYNKPEYETNEPIVITEVHRILDNYFDWRWGWEYAEFRIPQMYSFSDFEVLDMPIFLQQELLIPSTPPFLHHDGVTVMVPFMTIGRDWTFQFLGVSVALLDDGLWFGTTGGGSGETALMAVGGTRASGTGLSVNFTTPTMLVDGVLYIPLIEFFAGVSPALMTDAFIYNNEIHIVRRGWCALHGHSSRAGWGGETERPITADVSQLPIFINGERIEAPPPFLADCGYNIMLPVAPLTEVLGYTITTSPCGEMVKMQEEWWITPETPLVWVGDELYASYWCFFRDILQLGGFASESRIELFRTNTHNNWGW